MIHVNFKMFVDRPGIMAAVEKKRLKVLSRTGAYARTAMQRMIQPPKTGKKATRIVVRGVECIVPANGGYVLSAKTGKPVSKGLAIAAKTAWLKRRREQEPGRPPRRGPTDLLRQQIFFGVDTDTQSVVIGPRKFARQPKMVGTSSVPELLEVGGSELQKLFGKQVYVPYAPHPFVGPTLPIAERKFRELIETIPLI